MPQFDKITFLTQIHWLLISFFFLYYILLIYTPNLIMLLKLRKKRLRSYFELSELAEETNQLNRDTLGSLFNTIGNFSKNIVLKTNTSLTLWSNNFINGAFSSRIKELFLQYYGANLMTKGIFLKIF